MGSKVPNKQLSKLLTYVLGRRPDEFGLVPDQNGFIKIKELIQAMNEESDFPNIRRSLIDELLITSPEPLIEIADNLIRAVDRTALSPAAVEKNPPKLLYAAVTMKSYPVVLEKGIRPTFYSQVVLSGEETMATRIGKRKGSSPVILTVNVQQAHTAGVVFHKAGDLLFLADYIPPECFTGPPLPKQKPEPQKKQEKEKHKDFEKQRMAGSYFMDLEDKITREEKSGSWKRDKKRLRRQKQKKWPT